MRDILLKAIELKTGGLALEDLLPLEPTKKLLRDDSERLGSYDALVTKPQGLWPEPQSMSIVYGETQGLIFDTQSGTGQSAYVHGFTRGVAALATILNKQGLIDLQTIVCGVVPPMAIGDTTLPDVAVWLRKALLESAVNIAEKTDTYNLRDVLAFNYGLFWATAAVVPPEPKGRQKSALVWVKNVAEYFGSLGVFPNEPNCHRLRESERSLKW